MTTNPQGRVPRLETWQPAVTVHNVFSPAECDRIIALAGETKRGRLLGEEQAVKYRNCDVSWLEMEPEEHRWIYQRALDVARQANESVFHLDIIGFTERFQIITYKAGDHIDWHIDIGPRGQSLRKISMVIQLSDPESYVGGDFEFYAFYQAERMPRERGSVLVFPSYLLHRVSEVTAGERKSVRLLGRRPALPMKSITWIDGQ